MRLEFCPTPSSSNTSIPASLFNNSTRETYEKACRLYDAELSQKISEQLGRNRDYLNLAYTPIDLKNFRALCDALKSDTVITNIDLTACDLNDEHMSILVGMLRQNRTVGQVDLSSNTALTRGSIISLVKELKARKEPCTLIVTVLCYDEHGRNIFDTVNKERAQKGWQGIDVQCTY